MVNSLTDIGIKRVEIFSTDNTLVMNVEQPIGIIKPSADAGKHWEAIMKSELYEEWKPL